MFLDDDRRSKLDTLFLKEYETKLRQIKARLIFIDPFHDRHINSEGFLHLGSSSISFEPFVGTPLLLRFLFAKIVGKELRGSRIYNITRRGAEPGDHSRHKGRFLRRDQPEHPPAQRIQDRLSRRTHTCYVHLFC